jgi:hypothetical protein
MTNRPLIALTVLACAAVVAWSVLRGPVFAGRGW